MCPLLYFRKIIALPFQLIFVILRLYFYNMIFAIGKRERFTMRIYPHSGVEAHARKGNTASRPPQSVAPRYTRRS